MKKAIINKCLSQIYYFDKYIHKEVFCAFTNLKMSSGNILENYFGEQFPTREIVPNAAQKLESWKNWKQQSFKPFKETY